MNSKLEKQVLSAGRGQSRRLGARNPMPHTDINLGRVDPGYMAHCWFGRPLVLADKISATTEEIESELRSGCDGFVLQLTVGPERPGYKKQIATLEQILQSCSPVAFVYLELKADGIEIPTLEIVRKHAFPKGYMIASRNPRTLVELLRLDPTPNKNIALIVENEKDFTGLRHCPYTTVEIAEHLAAHGRIRTIHKSGKEVFVRASIDNRTRTEADERQTKKREKRLEWLVHAGVDAIITDQTKSLMRMMGLTES